MFCVIVVYEGALLLQNSITATIPSYTATTSIRESFPVHAA